MARFLCGDIGEVRGAVSTISIKNRHLASESTFGHAKAQLSESTRPVDNDDVMSALLQFKSGCQGFMTSSRVAIGMGNALTVRLFGTKGTAVFDLLRPSSYEIALFDGSGRSTFQSCFNFPSSPSVGQYAPVPHDTVSIGYGEVFSFMIGEFLESAATGKPFSGSIADGYEVARILDAIQMASTEGKAVRI